MSEAQESQPRKTHEEEVSRALEALQETVRTGKKPERRKAFRAFMESLHGLPDKYKSLIMKIRLDLRDERIEKYRVWLGRLGASSSDDEQMVYDLHILTPRKTPMGGGVTATHGSQVRERYFSRGEIGTVRTDMGYDQETKDDTVLLINPASLGALSVDNSLGKFWLFPRQIEGITLSADLPPYLQDEQKAFVEQFYSGE